MNTQLSDILEIGYLGYMFLWFQTHFWIHSPWEYSLMTGDSITQYLKHPVSSDEYESKICP